MTAAEYSAGTPGSGTPDPNQDVTYDYDPIGNRTEHQYDLTPPGEREASYSSNELNQYLRVLTEDTVNGDVAHHQSRAVRARTRSAPSRRPPERIATRSRRT
ncbi:MAG: hypothetical protein JXO22_16300 [Phycisphaerae bacterium]|nr:hypothetical protein [Phycisphaerae bacterium]